VRIVAVTLIALLAGCTGEIEPTTPGGGGADGAPGGNPDGAPGGNPDGAPGGGADGSDPGAGEPAGLVGITALHNQVRDTVGVPHMTWDPDLAAIAQAWAEQCIDNEPIAGLVDHNAGRSDNYPGYVGENIYGSGGTPTPEGAVGLWAAEEANYDYDTNSCAAGEVCGHYTQLVWRDSIKLGCGLAICSGLQYGGTIVCDYAPGGNSGGKPY
jgi:uncharacterized protein YkwD